MMKKCQFHWWRKPEYPEVTTDLQVPNPDRNGLKPGDLRYYESNALPLSATEAPQRPAVIPADHTACTSLRIMVLAIVYSLCVELSHLRLFISPQNGGL